MGPARARYEAILVVLREREADQLASDRARPPEEAEASQRRARAQDAERTRWEAEERARQAEAARNVAQASTPAQGQSLEYDDDWESSADDDIRGSEP